MVAVDCARRPRPRSRLKTPRQVRVQRRGHVQDDASQRRVRLGERLSGVHSSAGSSHRLNTMVSYVIQGERSALRPLTEDDADNIVDGWNDPSIALHSPKTRLPYTRDRALRWVAITTNDSEARVLAVTESESGAFCGVLRVPLQDGGHVSYWMQEWARGRGLMTEALALGLEWARALHGVERAVLTVHPGNAASRRVAEKAGFRPVGVVEQDPPFRDGETRAIRYERP